MSYKKLSGILAGFMLAGWVGAANALIIGTADTNTGNCFPFGCALGWQPTYQQVYDSSYFSGTLAISSLTFYNTAYDSGDYTPNTGTYTYYLSSTSAAADGLSTTAAANLGADNTNVYTGSLGGSITFGGQMNIILDSIFNYNPSAGNLLLTVEGSGLSQGAGAVYFDMNGSSSDGMSRVYSTTTDSLGLVTGFNEADDNGQVPTPGTLVLFGLGLAGLGWSRRKKA